MTSSPPCSVCTQLSDSEYARQKYGWEENDTHLPDAASSLVTVRELKSESSRSLIQKQCPQCSTYYLYETDYEYLSNGSEDEQTLTRISEDYARQYLAWDV